MLDKNAKGLASLADDKLVLIEQQRLAAMEKRRRQEVLLRSRLEELIQEEKDMCRISSKDIEARWMRFLRDKKQMELVAEIEIIRNSFEKTLDRKNAVIAMMSTDLQEAEDQYRLALQTHSTNVDSLIELQNRRLNVLEAEFEADLLQLRGDFSLEKAEIIRKHEIEKSDLQLIINNMNAEAEIKFRKLQEEISETRETATERLEEEQKQMNGEMEKINTSIQREIESRYKEFIANAQANLKDYHDKTKEDEETAEKIAAQKRKIAKLQESIATWKANLSTNIQECEHRNRDMKAEKEAISKHFKDLKFKMQTWRKGQAVRLAELVTEARKAQVALEKKAQGAERILRLQELCAQLETDREKILEFDANIATEEVEGQVKALRETRDTVADAQIGDKEKFKELFSREDETAGVGTDEWRMLEKFWVKYNKVVLDNAAIAQERFHLDQENQKLRQLLKQYLDGVSVSHEVMSKKNNLLQTGNFKNVVSMAEAKGRFPMAQTVTDGNKVTAEIAKQRNF